MTVLEDPLARQWPRRGGGPPPDGPHGGSVGVGGGFLDIPTSLWARKLGFVRACLSALVLVGFRMNFRRLRVRGEGLSPAVCSDLNFGAFFPAASF